MRKGVVAAFALAVACVLAVSAAAQPPGGQKGDKGDKGDKGPKGGFPGGKGGFGKGGFGFRPPVPGEVMPAPLQEMLKLTDEQKKQFADLQKEVDEKLAKLLTEDQRKQLQEMKDRGPGGFGPPGGFPGGPGGPPPKKGPGGE